MRSQRTCCAPPPGAAEANAVTSTSMAPTVMAAPSPQNRALRRILPSFHFAYWLLDADVALEDVLDRQVKDHRREQGQVQGPDARAARCHVDVERGGRLSLIAGLEHP